MEFAELRIGLCMIVLLSDLDLDPIHVIQECLSGISHVIIFLIKIHHRILSWLSFDISGLFDIIMVIFIFDW